MINLIPRTLKIISIGTASDKKIGNISSEVDKYTAIKVPSVITLAAYKLVAETENTHSGKTPKILPIKGPH